MVGSIDGLFIVIEERIEYLGIDVSMWVDVFVGVCRYFFLIVFIFFVERGSSVVS